MHAHRLASEGKMKRTGTGGRSSPFQYVMTEQGQKALQEFLGPRQHEALPAEHGALPEEQEALPAPPVQD